MQMTCSIILLIFRLLTLTLTVYEAGQKGEGVKALTLTVINILFLLVLWGAGAFTAILP